MESHETWTASSSNLQRKSMTADEGEARIRVEQLLQQLSSNSNPDSDDEKSKAAASLDKVKRSMDRMASLSQSMHEQLVSSRAASISASMPGVATGVHYNRTSGETLFRSSYSLVSIICSDVRSPAMLLVEMQGMALRLILAKDQCQDQLTGVPPPATVAPALFPPLWPRVQGYWSSYVMSSWDQTLPALPHLWPTI